MTLPKGTRDELLLILEMLLGEDVSIAEAADLIERLVQPTSDNEFEE